MPCKSCQSISQREFVSEIAIHRFVDLNCLGQPAAFVFPKIVVCLDCGFTEFSIPRTELRLLAEGD